LFVVRVRTRAFFYSRKEFFAMLMTKRDSDFGAPPGVYKAEFQGVFLLDNQTPQIGRDGKPMPPGMEWRFRILEGKFTDRLVTRITSREPTAKNSCGTLLDGVMGRFVPIGAAVDPDTKKGSVFFVTVQPSKGDPNKTQVVAVSPIDTSGFREPDVSQDAAF
jgi:hypothetical protein